MAHCEYDVRISEKVLLKLSEAAAYSGIGIHKLQRMAETPGCPSVLSDSNLYAIDSCSYKAHICRG